MIHFHSLEIETIEKETEDCVIISFKIPVALKNIFAFKQGQNLTLRKILGGEEVRRSYSICTSPFDNKLKVAVKKAEGGVFSTYANDDLKAGDFIDVMPPTGSFYSELNPSHKKNYLAFAAGSGITPILSIIKTTLQTEPQSFFTLVYGNRTKTSIIFKEALEALKDKYMERFCLYHVLSRESTEVAINSGRLDKEKCETFLAKLINIKTIDDYFICGPEAMIFCIKDLLEEKGIPKQHIHFELFTVPGEKTVTPEKSTIKNPIENTSQISVKLDGITFNFELATDGESILDAALAQGADLPYACKGGVCTTCKARLITGQVEMERNWGLDEEEVAKGFILTCQSHPRSKNIFIDFDDR